MAEATVQILAVDPRTVNTRYGDKTVYTIKADDGKSYDAWKADLGKAAASLVNQRATLTFEVKQNGEYTNYDVKSVTAANGSTPNPNAQPTAAPSGPTEKDKSIWRQSAHKVAYGFISNLYAGSGADVATALSEADELAVTLYKRFAGQSTAAPSNTAPAPTPQPEPAPVLAAAPEQPAAEAQDDLPWDAA